MHLPFEGDLRGFYVVKDLGEERVSDRRRVADRQQGVQG